MSNPLLEFSGLPGFDAIRPEHVAPAVDDVLAVNRRELSDILEGAGTGAPDFDSAVVPVEALAERLRRVWSPVSHLHAVANTPALRDAYNGCLAALTRYETELAQDERLFRVYEQVASRLPEDRKDGAPGLLRLALRDFRLAGVDLPDDDKQRFREIMEELSQLQARFEQNLLDSMSAWSLHETTAERVAGIPDNILDRAAAAAADAGKSGWVFGLDQPAYTAIMTHADDRDLRMQFYRAWVTRASDQPPADPRFDNTGCMEKILALRHEAAQLVGFRNYADYSLATKMADSVDEVRSFLDELALKAYPAAVRELGELEKFAGRALAAWDVAYYAEKLRKDRYALSDQELRPYFPVDTVLQGLFRLIGELYGLQVRRVENVAGWHPDVRYYQVLDDTGDEIGGFYIDLFARPNKRSGAWMDECLSKHRLNGTSQSPVAHLVCNLPPPGPSVPCLLTHNDVLTLFHEFGHILHHLLTRIEYPSVSGINGVPWDAVELPSQFMENFAWEPAVVGMISGHYETGQPLPAELLDRLRASRRFHAAMQMVRQLEFALFDLRLHAEYDPRRGSRINSILEQVRRQVSVVRHPEYNRFAHAFSHIFGGGYAAGYYSYKWAEVLAADAWSAFEETGGANRELATRFRREILEVGGTVDIADAYAAFRGRPPSIDALLRQSGIMRPGQRGS